jgi:hypothetical protein
LAKTIREAAFQTIQNNTNNESFEILDFEYDDGRFINDAAVNDIPNNGENEEVQQNNVVNRTHTSKSRKTKNSSKNDATFSYLSEKMNCENKYREEELRLKRKQHDDSIKLQEDVFDFKSAKLEFEERKWRDQATNANC